MLNSTYPIKPMSAMPTVLLEAFLAERAFEDRPEFNAPDLDEPEAQRIYATYEGARQRALVVGGLAGHDAQAAALLVAIDELDTFLTGGVTVGGSEAVRSKLDAEELGAIHLAHQTMVRLLEWHFKNGAGALLPIADWMGLVRGERA